MAHACELNGNEILKDTALLLLANVSWCKTNGFRSDCSWMVNDEVSND